MADEERLVAEISELKAELARKEAQLATLRAKTVDSNVSSKDLLTTEDVVRFSRQIILPQIGVPGMKNYLISNIIRIISIYFVQDNSV